MSAGTLTPEECRTLGKEIRTNVTPKVRYFIQYLWRLNSTPSEKEAMDVLARIHREAWLGKRFAEWIDILEITRELYRLQTIMGDGERGEAS